MAGFTRGALQTVRGLALLKPLTELGKMAFKTLLGNVRDLPLRVGQDNPGRVEAFLCQQNFTGFLQQVFPYNQLIDSAQGLQNTVCMFKPLKERRWVRLLFRHKRNPNRFFYNIG